MTGHDLETPIAERPMPVVLGPNDEPFAIDHHRVAATLWHTGIKSVPIVMVRDSGLIRGLLSGSAWKNER